MLALVLTVLTASLLGSTHCAGMCGAFVAFAVGVGGEAGPSGHRGEQWRRARWQLNAAYNGGRLLTYLTLGLIAGGLGAVLDLGGGLLGVQRLAAIGAGALMVGFGVVAVLRQLGWKVRRLPLPGALVRLVSAGHERAFAMAPLARAGVVGLLTTLLPCGWLYAFVVTSAGTASPLMGAVTMFAFWLGTLPILAALGFGVSSLAGPLRSRFPLAVSVLLVAVGFWTMLGRFASPAVAASSPGLARVAAQRPEAQHGASAAAGRRGEGVTRESIRAVAEETCSMCKPK